MGRRPGQGCLGSPAPGPETASSAQVQGQEKGGTLPAWTVPGGFREEAVLMPGLKDVYKSEA